MQTKPEERRHGDDFRMLLLRRLRDDWFDLAKIVRAKHDPQRADKKKTADLPFADYEPSKEYEALIVCEEAVERVDAALEHCASDLRETALAIAKLYEQIVVHKTAYDWQRWSQLEASVFWVSWAGSVSAHDVNRSALLEAATYIDQAVRVFGIARQYAERWKEYYGGLAAHYSPDLTLDAKGVRHSADAACQEIAREQAELEAAPEAEPDPATAKAAAAAEELATSAGRVADSAERAAAALEAIEGHAGNMVRKAAGGENEPRRQRGDPGSPPGTAPPTAPDPQGVVTVHPDPATKGEFTQWFDLITRMYCRCRDVLDLLTDAIRNYCSRGIAAVWSEFRKAMREISALYRTFECQITTHQVRPWVRATHVVEIRQRVLLAWTWFSYAASAARTVVIRQTSVLSRIEESIVEIREAISRFEADWECWIECRQDVEEVRAIVDRVKVLVERASSELAVMQETSVRLTRTSLEVATVSVDVHCEIAERLVVELRQLDCIVRRLDGFSYRSVAQLFHGVHEIQVLCMIDVDDEVVEADGSLWAELHDSSVASRKTYRIPIGRAVVAGSPAGDSGARTTVTPIAPRSADAQEPARTSALAKGLKDVATKFAEIAPLQDLSKKLTIQATAFEAKKGRLRPEQVDSLTAVVRDAYDTARLRLQSTVAAAPEHQRVKVEQDLESLEKAAAGEIRRTFGIASPWTARKGSAQP